MEPIFGASAVYMNGTRTFFATSALDVRNNL